MAEELACVNEIAGILSSSAQPFRGATCISLQHYPIICTLRARFLAVAQGRAAGFAY